MPAVMNISVAFRLIRDSVGTVPCCISFLISCVVQYLVSRMNGRVAIAASKLHLLVHICLHSLPVSWPVPAHWLMAKPYFIFLPTISFLSVAQ